VFENDHENLESSKIIKILSPFVDIVVAAMPKRTGEEKFISSIFECVLEHQLKINLLVITCIVNMFIPI